MSNHFNSLKRVFQTPQITNMTPPEQIKFWDSSYLKILTKYAQITLVKIIIDTTPVFSQMMRLPMKKSWLIAKGIPKNT